MRLIAIAIAFILAGLAGLPAQAANGKTELLWLGQAAFRISTPGGKSIVIDPWILGNPKTPAEWKDLAKLGQVDIILVTHAHGDHLGDAVALSKQTKAKVWGPAGLANSLNVLGLLTPDEAPRMNKGGTIRPLGPNIAISQVRADHSSEFLYTDPETKKQSVHIGGEPIGYIIKLENGFTIYHAGDTNVFGDMKMIGEYFKPDLALLPIGGHFVMDPKEAALAVSLLKPKVVIPMHYGTIPQLAGTPEEFKAALGKSKTKLIVMQPGQTQSF